MGRGSRYLTAINRGVVSRVQRWNNYFPRGSFLFFFFFFPDTIREGGLSLRPREYIYIYIYTLSGRWPGRGHIRYLMQKTGKGRWRREDRVKKEELSFSLSLPLSLPPRSTLSSWRLKNPTRASLTVLLSDTTTSIEPRREGTRRVFSFPLLLLPPLSLSPDLPPS